MAISLSGYKIGKAKQEEAERLAREYAEQQKKASERGFFSNILGGVGGKLLGGALGGLLSVTSGGLLAPLMGAIGSFGAKKGAQALTKGLGMGADPSKLASQSGYGFGKKEAQTLREGLEEQIAASEETDFGKELLTSYVMAGASGGLKDVGKVFKGGEDAAKGWLGTTIGEGGKEIVGTGKGLFQVGEEGLKIGGLKEAWEGGKAGLQEAWGDTLTWGGDPEDVVEDVPEDLFGTEEALDVFGNPISEVIESREGGLIPKYNIGGMVQAQSPSIANYFGMQGVSLGGSNKQSLAEMLGRK